MPGSSGVRLLEIPAVVSRTRKRAAVRDWLIVSTVPARTYGETALEQGLRRLEWVAPRALAHEAVIEHFLSARAVLPMQLFTLFTGDDRALEHVSSDRRRIEAILKRIQRQVEWGLRLTWNPDDPPSAAGRSVGRAPAPRKGAPSGSEYLMRKRDQLELSRTQLRYARSEADRIFKAVGRVATAARRRTETEKAAPGSRLLLDAAFLVPAGRSATFRTAVRRHTKAAGGSRLTASLTGPWPAYNFI